MELEVDGQEQESEKAESGDRELPRSDTSTKYDSERPRGQSAASSHDDEGTLSLSEPGMMMCT